MLAATRRAKPPALSHTEHNIHQPATSTVLHHVNFIDYKHNMIDEATLQMHVAHWDEGIRERRERGEWQNIPADSDSESEDDGLLTPVSLPSQPQIPQTAQHPYSPTRATRSKSSSSIRKIRPYACRHTKSLRIDRHSLSRPVVDTYGPDAVSLHPRRKGWVTCQEFPSRPAISMTFKRYRRQFVRAPYSSPSSSLLTIL